MPVSKKQADRFLYIATNSQHRFRPWMLSEVDKLLRLYKCLDANGKPSRFMIPLFKDGYPLYEHLCDVVSGPVPDSCLVEPAKAT